MPAPSDAPAQIQPVRRSVTLPTRLIARCQPKSDSPDASDKVIFSHPSAKIVHFAPRSVVPIQSSPTPSDFDYPVDTIETLPWRSATERTVACAPLKFEKIQGLTAFLKCGNVVHAILKNSQCWCVDGESIFVMRIRPLTYYRIELPNTTEEDKKYVADLKNALPQILRYEVTPCPFKRGFTVEIPMEAKIPRRKRAWRPTERRESAPAAPWNESRSTKDSGTRDQGSTGDDTDENATDDSSFTTKNSATEDEPITESEKSSSPIDIPPNYAYTKRPVAEPQQTVNALLARFETIPESESEAEASSLSTSADSFHSMQTPISPLPPSPPYSDSASPPASSIGEKLPIPLRRHSREISEITITPDPVSSATQTTPGLHIGSTTSLATQTSPAHSTFEKDPSPSLAVPLTSGLSDAASTSATAGSMGVHIEDRNSAVLRRVRASRKRDLSPMPPPSILFHPTPNDSGHHLTASILQKTCSIVLVPPFQLLVLLIQIAARIVVGHTVDSAIGDSPERSDVVDLDEQDSEDDFGIPIAPDLPRRLSGSPPSESHDYSELD